MGGHESKCCIDSEEEKVGKNVDSPASESPFRATRVIREDPRSPSTAIDRTPIEVSATPIQNPKPLMRVQPMVENSNLRRRITKDIDNAVLVDPRSPAESRTPIALTKNENDFGSMVDPRSPTAGIVRTPLIIEGAPEEPNLEENFDDTSNWVICETPKRHPDLHCNDSCTVQETEDLKSLDPRSPMNDIIRTPIANFMKQEKEMEVEKIVKDPRSPSNEINRSPLGSLLAGHHELRRTVLMTNALMASPLRKKVTRINVTQQVKDNELEIDGINSDDEDKFLSIPNMLPSGSGLDASCSSSLIASIGSDVDCMNLEDSIADDDSSVKEITNSCFIDESYGEENIDDTKTSTNQISNEASLASDTLCSEITEVKAKKEIHVHKIKDGNEITEQAKGIKTIQSSKPDETDTVGLGVRLSENDTESDTPGVLYQTCILGPSVTSFFSGASSQGSGSQLDDEYITTYESLDSPTCEILDSPVTVVDCADTRYTEEVLEVDLSNANSEADKDETVNADALKGAAFSSTVIYQKTIAGEEKSGTKSKDDDKQESNSFTSALFQKEETIADDEMSDSVLNDDSHEPNPIELNNQSILATESNNASLFPENVSADIGEGTPNGKDKLLSNENIKPDSKGHKKPSRRLRTPKAVSRKKRSMSASTHHSPMKSLEFKNPKSKSLSEKSDSENAFGAGRPKSVFKSDEKFSNGGSRSPLATLSNDRNSAQSTKSGRSPSRCNSATRLPRYKGTPGNLPKPLSKSSITQTVKQPPSAERSRIAKRSLKRGKEN